MYDSTKWISAVGNMSLDRILAKNYPSFHCLIPNFTEQAVWLLLNDSFIFKSYNLDRIIVVQIVSSHPVLVKFWKSPGLHPGFFEVLVVYRVISWSSFALSIYC